MRPEPSRETCAPYQATDSRRIDIGHVGDVDDQQIRGVRPDLGLEREEIPQQEWTVNPQHHVGPVGDFLYLQWLILHNRRFYNDGPASNVNFRLRLRRGN